MFRLSSVKFNEIKIFLLSVKLKEEIKAHNLQAGPVKSPYFLCNSFTLRSTEKTFKRNFVNNTCLCNNFTLR